MFTPTIGLEIHVELATETKMFCSCRNDFDEKHPNINVCPICLGHPGTLPTINQKAVESVIRLGLALGAKITSFSNFDRKSYFYPDLPKGYQISQYKNPLVENGILKDVRIRRIHLEEDTARLLHIKNNKGEEISLVDFNRSGVPLMELVTEPDIKNAQAAVEFAKELHLILRYLGISNADMEKGQMRIEANVSLNRGTKVEVKNINSFRAVEGAIEYEIRRQRKNIETGKKIVQETRGWNEKEGITKSQRSKESSHDYRYFPEPDLPPLDLEIFDLESLKAELPELPEAKRRRFIQEYNLDKEVVDLLVEDKAEADYFEEAASELKSRISTTNPLTPSSGPRGYRLLTNYFTSDLRGLMKEQGVKIIDLKINPEEFAHLVSLVEKGNLSSRLAKDLLLKMLKTGEDPEVLMREGDINLISDESQLEEVITQAITKNPQAVTDYKKGKANALQFLLGNVMAITKGKADPKIVKRLLNKRLKD